MFAVGQLELDVLMLVGSAGPVAFYFLSLGLVNCHARPCLITTRSDFIALSVALAPLPLWSLPVAIQLESGWMLGLAAILLAIVFRKLVPGRHDGFVIYNTPRRACLNLLDKAISRISPTARRTTDGEWLLPDEGLRIDVRSLALLRTVSIQIVADGEPDAAFTKRLRGELERCLAGMEQLPSPVGAGLVLTGLCIAFVPMWLVTRHIHDLVEVVARFFG